jgi:hypothetical protein
MKPLDADRKVICKCCGNKFGFAHNDPQYNPPLGYGCACKIYKAKDNNWYIVGTYGSLLFDCLMFKLNKEPEVKECKYICDVCANEIINNTGATQVKDYHPLEKMLDPDKPVVRNRHK